ncbi:MAG: hypothetical protein J6W27_00720 [Alphaproteobacteria bacterium]|nr:hypothetical protein [Alphaproteobacteria bacterium]
MPLKPRYKRRITWAVISFVGLVLMAIITIPPFVNLNSMKPKIEEIILNQTGVRAKIHGDVNFSLLGKTVIVAHNISVPNGIVSSCEFTVPFYKIFNLENAQMTGNMIINRAFLSVDKIVPFDLDTNVVINNSQINFLNKDYHISSAFLSKRLVDAIVETDQHTYKITSRNNHFVIKNKNNELTLSGTLYADGTADAQIDINAQNINRWFEFDKPKINGRFPITADIKWNGSYGFDFTNISANNVSGAISLKETGYKIIKLKTKNADYDLSFVLKDPDVLKNTAFDLDLTGKIKFLDKTFKHLFVNIVGFDKEIKIHSIKADDIEIRGGTIDESGAHNLLISFMENKIKTTCLFNGTPDNWNCDKFSYGKKIYGNLNVQRNEFTANILSKDSLHDINKLIKSARRIGKTGTIKFAFQDMSGIINIDGKHFSVKYDFVKNKSLNWAKIDLPFLPEFMLNENGTFVWKNNSMMFVPNSESWTLSTTNDYFYISGDNFKNWFKDIDLQCLKNLSYVVSGYYKNGNISNLILDIAQHRFVGSVSGKSITLKTDVLNIDSFTSQSFINNFEQISFFTPAPITIPFELHANISLSAGALIYQGKEYNNFVYSLKPNIQTFSITDSDRGNLLATLSKSGINYDISIQLNKFILDNKLLHDNMPLNISNSTVTAEIKLKTSGKISHDFTENISGSFDAAFSGGTLYGFGLEKFYASAQSITTLNAEYALSDALESGTTPLKKMRVIGNYSHGNIKTTSPLTLSVRHTDISGSLEINDNKMFTILKLILRGTSPKPAPIDLIIYNDGFREYSLSEIMTNFDPDYMRSFTKSHNQF